MFRNGMILGALSITVALSGCGGSAPDAPAPSGAAPAAAPVAAPAVVEEAKPVMDGPAEPASAPAPTEAAPAAEAAAAVPAGAADPLHQKLFGTKWKLGEFDVEFKDATTVHLNGGPLTMITGGKGMDATYTFKAGAIEVSAMGQTKTGTWDGTALVMDGEAGVKQ